MGLLGVGPGAAADEVQDAFRREARRSHPDTGGEGGIDLDELSRARDVLLEPASPSASPPRANEWRRRPEPGTSTGAQVAWGSVIVLGVVLAASIIAVAAVALTRDQSAPEVLLDEVHCVRVVTDGVQAVDCGDADAQEVVHQFVGSGRCPAGSNELGSGSATWCLQPATSQP